MNVCSFVSRNMDGYFEGEYRRKPSQNLSGVRGSRKVLEFIDKVKNDRRKREEYRVEIEKVIIIQAAYRGNTCRKYMKSKLNLELSNKIFELNKENKQNINFNLDDIRYLICHIRLIYPRNYNWNSSTINNKHDYDNILYISSVLLKSKSAIIQAMATDSDWIWRIIYILYVYMDLIKSLPIHFEKDIPGILEMIKGFLDPSIYLKCNNSKDMINVLITIMEKLLSNGLFKILILMLDNKYLLSQHTDYKNILNCVQELFSTILSVINTTERVDFRQSSLQLLAEEVICKKMLTETKNTVFLLFKEIDKFPLQALIEAILNYDHENLYSIHALNNFLSYFDNEEIMKSIEEENTYFLLLSKFTLHIPLLQNSLQPLDEREATFPDHREQYCILNNCLNQINSSERTERWLTSLLAFVKRRDYNGLCWFFKCIYHLWLYDCSPIYKYRLIRKIALEPRFLKELWNYIQSEKRILSFSSQLYSATVLSMLSNGVVITASEADRIMPSLTMFCFFFKSHISLLSDELLYDENFLPEEKQITFSLNEIVYISTILKEVAVGIISLAFPSISMHGVEQRIDLLTPTRHLEFNTKVWRILLEQIVSLLRLLHDRDCRRQFREDSSSFWLSSALQEMNQSFFQYKKLENVSPFSSAPECINRAFTVYESRYFSTLQILPFTIKFLKRFSFFQDYIAESKQEFQDPRLHFLQIPYILLRIRRDYLYEDAFDKIALDFEIRKVIRVHLVSSLGVEEPGVDGGGLFREFMVEFLKTAFDPNRGFFVLNLDNELYPNPNIDIICDDFRTHYNFIGKMLGKALYENILVEVPLADFFLSGIMGHCKELCINGLATLDPDLYKNIVSLSCFEGDLSELNIDFTLTLNDFGESRVVELKENGRNISVTEENVLEYIHLVARFKANTQIQEQTSSFFEGLGSIVSLEWLRIFTARELQLIISGTKSPIDVDDMKEHTVYTGGYSEQHPTIIMFWNVVNSFSNIQRSLLLKFVTSCSRPPLLGFKELFPPFCIQFIECDNNRLPTSSTCMNILKLPEFSNEDIMKERLLYAIQSRCGFELI